MPTSGKNGVAAASGTCAPRTRSVVRNRAAAARWTVLQRGKVSVGMAGGGTLASLTSARGGTLEDAAEEEPHLADELVARAARVGGRRRGALGQPPFGAQAPLGDDDADRLDQLGPRLEQRQ